MLMSQAFILACALVASTFVIFDIELYSAELYGVSAVQFVVLDEKQINGKIICR